MHQAKINSLRLRSSRALNMCENKKNVFAISLLHRYENRGFLDPLTKLLIIWTAPTINSLFHISVWWACR